MSESENKKCGLYRKNREKWIFAQSVIVIVVAIAVLISALVSHQLNKKYYIKYTESGSINIEPKITLLFINKLTSAFPTIKLLIVIKT